LLLSLCDPNFHLIVMIYSACFIKENIFVISYSISLKLALYLILSITQLRGKLI
jgi:hypothetical protein